LSIFYSQARADLVGESLPHWTFGYSFGAVIED